MSQSIASTSNATFWWALQTQTQRERERERERVIFVPVRAQSLDLEPQNFENPIFTFQCFSLKAVYNYCKLQRPLQVAKFLFMYSFTHTNIVILSRHLPTETVIFINETSVTKWSVLVVIIFPFLRSWFCYYSTYFFYFIWRSNKVFKDIKGTLMQIWKSANMFVFIWKEHVENFILKHLLLFEICAREICESFFTNIQKQKNMLKISLLFKKFTNFTGK